MSTGRKTEKNGKTNSKSIVKRCTLIRRRREKHKKNRTLQKKGDQQFTDECRKTWYCKPGQRCLTTWSTDLKAQL